MKYQLLDTGGVFIDRIPVLRDVRDTFEVSFLLPGNGSYIAVFAGADGAEYLKL